MPGAASETYRSPAARALSWELPFTGLASAMVVRAAIGVPRYHPDYERASVPGGDAAAAGRPDGPPGGPLPDAVRAQSAADVGGRRRDATLPRRERGRGAALRLRTRSVSRHVGRRRARASGAGALQDVSAARVRRRDPRHVPSPEER